MKRLLSVAGFISLLSCSFVAWLILASAQTVSDRADEAALQELRNLGKAFYETPGSSQQAVEQLKKALDSNPGTAQEHLNYGLALLRAGQREEGMAQVIEAQKLDRTLPHTYFNLGIEYKKSGEPQKAIDQLLQMEKLVPDEAKTQYNLGALYKQINSIRRAIEKFERATELDSSMAAPHFQLFGILRRLDADRASEELEIFKALKAAQDEVDMSEDVDWSFYSELYDPTLATGMAVPAVEYVFAAREVTQVQGKPLGVLTLDLNGDKATDVLVWSEQGASVLLGGSSGPALRKIELQGALFYGAGDFDGDGLADFCRIDQKGVSLLVNQGGGSVESRFGMAGKYNFCMFADYDHDNDYDLLALGEEKRLFQNDGEGSLKDVSEEFPFSAGTARAAVRAELFEDNGNDFVIVYGNKVAVHEDRKLGRYDDAVEIADVSIGEGPVRMDVVDANHDGYLDIAVSTAAGTRILVNHMGTLENHLEMTRVEAWADFQLRGRIDAVIRQGFVSNQGAYDFKDAAATEQYPGGVSSAGDFNLDGKPDLISAQPDGKIWFSENLSKTSNNGLTIRLEGVKSPRIATGTRVEVKAGLSYAKQVYTGVPLHFGLGAREMPDAVRLTWPNGLIQNEMLEEPKAVLDVKEAPRLSGSCPMIYTWNGNKFEYISEVLGVAPLGASLARNVYFPVDHNEYVQIQGDQLVERDSYYDVKLTEELRETAYIDQIKLLVVDHPPDIQIVTNEKAKGPPFPEFKLFGITSRLLPTSAINHRGNDLLAEVSTSDRRYVMFERDFQNRAEVHSLTVEFPEFEDSDAVLFLEGWVDWSSASNIVAASQTTASTIQPPYLEVQDDSGNWVKVVPDLGLPGGTLRTIAVDLSGLFPSSKHRLRIVTNMCVYWDAVYMALGSKDPEVQLTTLDASVANLSFHGFSRNHVSETRTQPEQFVYEEVSNTTMWNPTPGMYTRFGDVQELVDSEDDRYVIMGAGDEIALRFSVTGVPAIQPGWRREYLLFVDGWAKENEANTAFGDSVYPLPFHGMSGYPYGPDEHYPDSPLHQSDLEQYHIRPAMRLLRPLVAGSVPR